MSFDTRQFRSLVQLVLESHGLHSEAAENLLLGTCAQESAFGTYIRQIRGPARGVMQVEPATFDWLRDKYQERFGDALRGRVAPELEWNLWLSILIARLRYLAVPEALPDAGDVSGLAAYWKKYYNTVYGAGTTDEFEANFARWVR